MRLSTYLWCGMLLMGLGVAALGLKRHLGQVHNTQAKASSAIPPKEVVEAPEAPIAEIQPFAPAVRARALFNIEEPIGTHAELPGPVGEPGGETPVLLSGGTPEAELLTTPIPRPDEESRRMPYADEKESASARR